MRSYTTLYPKLVTHGYKNRMLPITFTFTSITLDCGGVGGSELGISREGTRSLWALFNLGLLETRVMTGLKVDCTILSSTSSTSSSSLQMEVTSVTTEFVLTSFFGGISELSWVMELERVCDNQATPEPPDLSISTSSTKSNQVRPQRRLNWKITSDMVKTRAWQNANNIILKIIRNARQGLYKVIEYFVLIWIGLELTRLGKEIETVFLFGFV